MVMMMALGPVTFDLVTNLTETEQERDVVFAKHDVVNSDPIYEPTGGDEAPFVLSGVIHPEHLGVRGDLAKLEQAQQQQIPLTLMRGTREPLGWVIIKKLKRNDNWLNEFGVGREIKFTVHLLRVGRPGLSMIPRIMSLFR